MAGCHRGANVDNLAHSLAGAALAAAGLGRKTALGTATLVLAANLPDVDALGLLFGENLAWRRGWTHGPLAMLVLPPLLVAALVGFDRWQTTRGTRPADRPALHRGWLMVLAYVGWFSHPLLDFMNTYGIRLLMPFSERWFYGDVLFIIDIWLWIALGLGVWLSRRRQRAGAGTAEVGRPAQISLAVVLAYIAAMGASSVAAERWAKRAAEARGLGPVRTVVASPVPVNPFRRRIVFATDRAYGMGVLDWLPSPRLTLEPGLMLRNMDDPAVAAARKVKAARDFLYWSRLPYARVERTAAGTRVILGDARYVQGGAGSAFVQTVDLGPAQQPRGTAHGP